MGETGTLLKDLAKAIFVIGVVTIFTVIIALFHNEIAMWVIDKVHKLVYG